MGKSLIHLWKESKLVGLDAERYREARGEGLWGRKAEGYRGQTMQSLVGCLEEFGLYYNSSGKPQANLKQRNAMIYCVFKRSSLLHSGEGLKRLLGDQRGVWCR